MLNCGNIMLTAFFAVIFSSKGWLIMINNTTRHVIGEFPVTTKDPAALQEKLEQAYHTLLEGTGAGSEMLGWMTWPEEYLHTEEYARLKETAEKIRETSDTVVVIGIGGSYLTPKAVIDSFYGDFYQDYNDNPEFFFCGCDLSPDKLIDIINQLALGDWSIIYISKSGGTMEPALAFRTLWAALYSKYGEEANSRVYAVTDKAKGTLKSLADEHGWESFVIPDNIGGRYSGFTACGLLPLAVAGIKTDRLLQGAIKATNDCMKLDSFAAEYAKWRYLQYNEGWYSVEFFATNTPDLAFFAEWLKQLFGESEGKNNDGLFPTSGVFPRDLHSLGQYLQEGKRGLIFETFIEKDFYFDVEIPAVELNDGLDKYVGKTFAQAASAAMDGAFKAHSAGGNPCGKIRFGAELDDLGYLMQSMFFACAFSAYMRGVNPFNQPGVEEHKKNMRSSPLWDMD